MTKRSTLAVAAALMLLASAGSGSAAYPGANGKLVFAKNGDLWTIEADGRALTRLTKTRAGEYAPSWSPDGSRLAYGYGDGGADNVHVAGADGSDPVDLTAASLKGTPAEEYGDYCDSDPTWSPDGKWIAFSTVAYDCTGAAGVIDKFAADGSRRTEVNHDYDGLLGGDTQPVGPGRDTHRDHAKRFPADGIRTVRLRPRRHLREDGQGPYGA